MPVYIVQSAVTIRGNLTVRGNLITARTKDSLAHFVGVALPLADLIGSAPVVEGPVAVDGSLLVPAYADSPVFAVGGCIAAMGEVTLDN